MRRRRNRFREQRFRRKKKQMRLDFARKGSGQWNKELVRSVLTWAAEILLVIALAGVLVFCFGTRVTMSGSSMAGTLDNKDTVLVNRVIYKLIAPKANDIIVFLPNGNQKSHYYIKRVIAVPGDTVQIIDGTVYVNEEVFDEQIENPTVSDALLAEEPVTVGEDEYFVLGDNRDSSEDSRYANIGNVKSKDILGKAWFVVSPLKKFGTVK